MARADLLPGVLSTECPPVVSTNSADTIRRARRVAAYRDAAQLLLLLAVDWLFFRWPSSHVPLVGRDQSAMLVALANGAILTAITIARMFPRWRARKIAATWSLRERSRFFAEQRSEQTAKQRQ